VWSKEVLFWLDKMVREEIPEEVIFEQRDLKDERKSHVKFEEVSPTQ